MPLVGTSPLLTPSSPPEMVILVTHFWLLGRARFLVSSGPASGQRQATPPQASFNRQLAPALAALRSYSPFRGRLKQFIVPFLWIYYLSTLKLFASLVPRHSVFISLCPTIIHTCGYQCQCCCGWG